MKDLREASANGEARGYLQAKRLWRQKERSRDKGRGQEIKGDQEIKAEANGQKGEDKG